jgi:hypothetical protein
MSTPHADAPKDSSLVSPHEVSIAFVGYGQQGKSSLVNAVRGLRPSDPDAAEVHVRGSAPHSRKDYVISVSSLKSRLSPGAYVETSETKDVGSIRLIDVPGAGSDATPIETYIEHFELHTFDCFLVLVTPTLDEATIALLKALKAMGKPFWLVCARIDQLIREHAQDTGLTDEQAVVEDIRRITSQSVNESFIELVKPQTHVFLVSNSRSLRMEYDMPDLLRLIIEQTSESFPTYFPAPLRITIPSKQQFPLVKRPYTSVPAPLDSPVNADGPSSRINNHGKSVDVRVRIGITTVVVCVAFFVVGNRGQLSAMLRLPHVFRCMRGLLHRVGLLSPLSREALRAAQDIA